MHTKRIAAGYGKRPKWVSTPNGPHRRGESIPLALVVRDILGYADNAREAQKIIKGGMVLVDKKVCKDPTYGVGLMDLVEIPKTGEYFRVLPSPKKNVLKPVDAKEAAIKPCKIVGKKLVEKGRVQLNLHDGSNLLVDDNKYKVKDTVVLELPERKISEWIEFGEGKQGMIALGRHRGGAGKIGATSPGNEVQHSLTEIGEFHTRTDYIFVIGKDKPLISI